MRSLHDNIHATFLTTLLVFTVVLTLLCADPARAGQQPDASTKLLLQQPVHLEQTLSTDQTVIDEAFAFSAGSSVPLCVEVLTDYGTGTIAKLKKPPCPGDYTVKSALESLQSQGHGVTWKIVDQSVFIIIKKTPSLDDPLDDKLQVDATLSMTVQDWVNWLYTQDPITGFQFVPPYYDQKISYHISKGETIRSVFAHLAEATGSRWFFDIAKNNYIVSSGKSEMSGPASLTADELRYLDRPAVGNQYGRTGVYYWTKTHASMMP